MAKRNVRAKAEASNVYGSGLPKGRKLKDGGKDQRGGYCTLPPNVRTTDDLVRLLRHELRNLLAVIGELASPEEETRKTTRREEIIKSFAWDAEGWCEAIADALDSGKWTRIELDKEAAGIWADAVAEVGARALIHPATPSTFSCSARARCRVL